MNLPFFLMMKVPNIRKSVIHTQLDELYDNYMDAVPGNDSIQKFEQLITDGILDAVPIIFYDTDASTPNTWTLPLTPDEAAALQSFYSDETDSLSVFDRLKKTYADTYAIKDSYLYTHNYNNSLNDLLFKINTAIDCHSCLYMKYYSRREKWSYVLSSVLSKSFTMQMKISTVYFLSVMTAIFF